VYVYENTVMMSIQDIARMTRCTLSIDDNVYTMQHANGMRIISVDPAMQTISENDEQYEIMAVEYNDKLLVPAYRVLTYLGAECSYDATSQSFCVAMPLHTFWETLSFSRENRMYPLVRDETWKNVSIVCDLIVDVMAPLSGRSLWEILFLGGADEKSAVYEALLVDITKYESVQANMEARRQKLNDVASALSIAKKFQDAQYDLSAFLNEESMTDFYSAIYALKKTERIKLFTTYQSTMKSRIDFEAASKDYNSAVNLALFILDTFTTTLDRLQIDEVTALALIRTFSQDSIRAAGDPSLDETYLSALKEVSSTVSSSSNIVADTFMEKSASLVVNKFGSAIEKKVLPSKLALSLELAGLIAEVVGRLPYVGKYTPFGEVSRAEADLKSILTADLYLQTNLIYEGIANKAAEEKYHEATTMQQLYDAYMMLLRFSLVHFESLAQHAENTLILQDAKEKLAENADAIASVIDKLYSSNPSVILRFSDLNDPATAFDEVLIQGIKEQVEAEFIASLPAFPTIDLFTDAVNIVAVLPSGIDQYEEDVAFRVIVDYSLQSVENGVVYLGFNLTKLGSYSLLEQHLVEKGSGRIILEATTKPVKWGSAWDYLWAGANFTTVAFKAYVNISEYPHADSWSPFDDDIEDIPYKE